MAGALQAAAATGGSPGSQIAGAAREAYVSGMHLAAIVAGCVSLVAATIVYRLLPSANPHTGVAAAGRTPTSATN